MPGPNLGRIVTFDVAQAFRGVTDKAVEVMTGQRESDCSFEFTEGISYLVYASSDLGTGMLVTSVCTRTRLLSQAKDDLDYLNKKDDPARAFGIVGVVNLEKRDDQNKLQITGPAPGITVVISGVALRLTAVTKKDGTFELWGLQPGSYRVSLTLGEEFLKTAQTVKVGGEACEGVDLFVAPVPPKKATQ